MRYDGTHKAETRARIVAGASARLRREGLNAVGLRALVADAGVTHGAFYAHFASRDELVAAAVALALAQTRESLSAAAGDSNRLDRLAASYLRIAHVTTPERGCAGAALGPELAREPPLVRQAFSDGIAAIAGDIADMLPPGGDAAARLSRARAIFAGMMGAVQLARTLEGGQPVEDLLDAARRAVRATADSEWPSA